jgi:MFS family permease
MLAGAVGAVLKQSLHISDAQVGTRATFYLIGAVVGALGFGYATDRLGVKNFYSYSACVFDRRCIP